jgi:hypothetical protein
LNASLRKMAFVDNGGIQRKVDKNWTLDENEA